MAELALLASIVQVADVGLRLSLRLYTFGETVASADRFILAISKDVSFTSSVLKELGRVFEDDKARIHSDNATNTAEAVVQECSDIFQEMDGLLLKKVPNLKPGLMDKKARAKAMLERLRWPVLKGKIELLNCNLDRMKTTLTLMLNVIIYAQQVSKRNEPASVMTEQIQLIEILAQAKEERDQALEQAKRVLDYKLVEPSNDTPSLTTINLMAMSVGLKKSEQSQGSNDTPLVPSQARTFHTEPDKSSHLEQLLDAYTRLQKSLIDEIHSEQYIIQQDSRKRLKVWVDNAHDDEVRRLTVTYPYYYDTNGEFKKSKKRQMQPSNAGALVEDVENLLQGDNSDDTESKPTDRTANLCSQRSEITPIIPRPPASEPELKENEDKLLPLQLESILRKSKDRFPEYSTTKREDVTPQPSQPIKEPLQPLDSQAGASIKGRQRRLSIVTKEPPLSKTDFSSVEVRHPSSTLLGIARTKVKPTESHIGAENMNMGQASASPSSSQKKLRPACENCHMAKIRCGGDPCTSCFDNGWVCIRGVSNRIGRPKGSKNKRTMERLIRKNENNQEQTDNIPFFKSGQTLSSLKSRSTSSQPDNARDLGKKKDSDAMSEYRDSSDMNEGKYNRAPLKPHDCYTVADVGAPDMDIDLDMALHVDGRGSEGLTRLGERAEEDGRERGNGKAEREESQEAEGEEAAEAEGERAAERVDNEEVNSFNSDQPWNWWSMEILDETVKLKERQEHADAGHKASVADRLLAAWTTVKLVI